MIILNAPNFQEYGNNIRLVSEISVKFQLKV